jgi:hypothetical protein
MTATSRKSLSTGCTGANEKSLRKANISLQTLHLHPGSYRTWKVAVSSPIVPLPNLERGFQCWILREPEPTSNQVICQKLSNG